MSLALLPLLIPDVLCVLVCGIATVTDLRSFRIPNWLTIPAIVAGLVLNPLLFGLTHGSRGFQAALFSSIAGCLLLGLVFIALGVINFVGMGDAKLMAAVGALLGWPTALYALAYVTIAGGVLAIVYAGIRGQLGTVFSNLFQLSKRIVKKSDEAVTLHRIPYAVAIFIGATWAALIKYFPFLRLP